MEFVSHSTPITRNWQNRARVRQNRQIFFRDLTQHNPMPETLEPVERVHKIPGTITPHGPRGRRHKRKRRLSAHQKQVRLFAAGSAVILIALFLGFLWWLSLP